MWDMSITMIRKSFMSVIQHWEYLPIYTNMLIYPELLKNQQPLWVIARGLALQDHQDMTEVYWITLKLSYFPGQHIYRYKKNTIISKTSIHHSRHQAIQIQSTISSDVFCKPISPGLFSCLVPAATSCSSLKRGNCNFSALGDFFR